MVYAVMGTATGSGEKRTLEAAQRAIASPLLEAGAIDGARGILINITGSNSLKLAEVQQACTIIQSAAHEDANIIFGAVMDEKMKDTVKITVIATGFREAPAQRRRREETRSSFAARHDDAMDFPEPVGPAEPMSEPMPEPRVPTRIMSEPMSELIDDRAFVADPAPGAVAHASTEVISLNSVRSAMVASFEPANLEQTNFERDDLDVPAFLRKRGEVM